MLPAKPLAQILGICGSILLAAGCSSDDKLITPEESTGSVRIHLRHVVGEDSLLFHRTQYLNSFGNTYGVDRLQYYISDIEFRGPDGDEMFALVQYIDGEDSSTREFQIDEIPEGQYADIVFTFGLDEEKNVTGALPENENNRNMFWPETLGGGYHYMRLEGKFLGPDDGPIGFRTHFGRLQEHPDSTAYHHFFTVPLSAGIDVVRNTVKHVEIIVDINRWYTGRNEIDLATHTEGIMSNTDAQNMIEENGVDVFALGEITNE
jgi:hypothetical protein